MLAAGAGAAAETVWACGDGEAVQGREVWGTACERACCTRRTPRRGMFPVDWIPGGGVDAK